MESQHAVLFCKKPNPNDVVVVLLNTTLWAWVGVYLKENHQQCVYVYIKQIIQPNMFLCSFLINTQQPNMCSSFWMPNPACDFVCNDMRRATTKGRFASGRGSLLRQEQSPFEEPPPECTGSIGSRDNHNGNVRNGHPPLRPKRDMAWAAESPDARKNMKPSSKERAGSC